MTELSPNFEPEQQPRIQVESLAESVERLKATSRLELVEPEDSPDFQYHNYSSNEDGRKWMITWSQPDGTRMLDPTSAKDVMLFNDANIAAVNDTTIVNSLAKKARWWETPYKKLDEKVAEGVKERIVVEDGLHSLELFNLHESLLTAKEITNFEQAMAAVVQLSQGKAMDRIKGIVILGADNFPEGVAGSFGSSNRVMTVNLDALRDDQTYIDEHPEISTRYDRFFKGALPSQIEITLAHELGHALDIHTKGEADKLGLDKTSATNGAGQEVQGISAFQNDFGWQLHHVEQRDFDRKNTWKIDDAEAAESRELPLTSYAATAPGEDFAETFAIMALGGDLSSAPTRVRKIHETIAAVEGDYAVRDLTIKHYDAATSDPITAKLKPTYHAAAYTKVQE